MNSLSRVVLITGCSSGIGKACAEYLRKRGWRVFAAARKQEDCERLQQEGFESFLIDVTRSDSMRSGVLQMLGASGGRIDALVNNAGILVVGAVEDISPEGMRRQFEVNFFGALELTKLVIPVMRTQHAGRIVFLSSPNSNGFGYPFLGIEAASKAALETAVSALRRELHSTGISVSTVCPAEMRTAIMKKAAQSLSSFVDIHNSVHKVRYLSLQKYFMKEERMTTVTNPLRVAEAIGRILESARPLRRIMIPRLAGIHYWAHIFLPEWLQDKFLFKKMKDSYNITL